MDSTAELSKLYISDSNVRKTDRALDIEPLADDIAAHGLIEPLVVVDEGAGRRKYGVIAGGRRLLALQLLEQRGWPTTRIDRLAIPISVRPAEESREISLSENIHKVAMNGADEVEAFAAIVADYEARGEADPAVRIARCALHFGKTERYVEQRLRLAGLAPEILDAWRQGRIGLEAAKAYAAVADHALQMQVFAAQERQAHHSVAAIRAAFAGKMYRVGDRQVSFVGLQAYVAAGGRVDRDLFMGIELEEVVLDTELLDRLAREKGEAEAQRLAVEAGFGGAILKGWGAASWLWPSTPEGFQKVFSLAAMKPADRASALAIAIVAQDGCGIELSDEGFRPAEAPIAATTRAPAAGAATASTRTPPFMPAAPAARESDLERLARIRRDKIDAATLRLAIERLLPPADGRVHMPPPTHDGRIDRVQEDGEHIAIAVYVKVAKAELGRFAGEAEALVDHELEGRAPPAPAPRKQPEPDFEDAERPAAEAVS